MSPFIRTLGRFIRTLTVSCRVRTPLVALSVRRTASPVPPTKSAQRTRRPGGIAGLTKEIAHCGLSIKDIYHERAWLRSRVDQVQVRASC